MTQQQLATAAIKYQKRFGDSIYTGLNLPESSRGATSSQMVHMRILASRVRIAAPRPRRRKHVS